MYDRHNPLSAIVAQQLPEFVRIEHPSFVAFLEAYYEWLNKPQAAELTAQDRAFIQLTIQNNTSSILPAHLLELTREAIDEVVTVEESRIKYRTAVGNDTLTAQLVIGEKQEILVAVQTAKLVGNAYLATQNLKNVRDIDYTFGRFVEEFKKTYLLHFPEKLAIDPITGRPVDARKLIKNIKAFYQARGTEKSYEFLFRVLFDTALEFYYPKVDILRASDGKWIEEKSIRVTTTTGSDLYLAVNKVIRQVDPITGKVLATGRVTRASTYHIGAFAVTELFLTGISGIFTTGKPVEFDTDETPPRTIREVNVFSCFVGVEVDPTRRGVGHQIGEEVIIQPASGDIGTGARAIVDRVGTNGSIESVRVTNFGANYKKPPLIQFAISTEESSSIESIRDNDDLLATEKETLKRSVADNDDTIGLLVTLRNRASVRISLSSTISTRQKELLNAAVNRGHTKTLTNLEVQTLQDSIDFDMTGLLSSFDKDRIIFSIEFDDRLSDFQKIQFITNIQNDTTASLSVPSKVLVKDAIEFYRDGFNRTDKQDIKDAVDTDTTSTLTGSQKSRASSAIQMSTILTDFEKQTYISAINNDETFLLTISQKMDISTAFDMALDGLLSNEASFVYDAVQRDKTYRLSLDQKNRLNNIVVWSNLIDLGDKATIVGYITTDTTSLLTSPQRQNLLESIRIAPSNPFPTEQAVYQNIIDGSLIGYLSSQGILKQSVVSDTTASLLSTERHQLVDYIIDDRVDLIPDQKTAFKTAILTNTTSSLVYDERSDIKALIAADNTVMMGVAPRPAGQKERTNSAIDISPDLSFGQKTALKDAIINDNTASLTMDEKSLIEMAIDSAPDNLLPSEKRIAQLYIQTSQGSLLSSDQKTRLVNTIQSVPNGLISIDDKNRFTDSIGANDIRNFSLADRALILSAIDASVTNLFPSEKALIQEAIDGDVDSKEVSIAKKGAIGYGLIGPLCEYPGFYANNDGRLSSNKVSQDNRYYQDFSYVLKAELTIDKYRDIVKKLLHPAGFAFFGQVSIKRCAKADLDKSGALIQYEVPLIGHYAPYTPETFENFGDGYFPNGFDPTEHEPIITSAGGNPTIGDLLSVPPVLPLSLPGYYPKGDPFWIVYHHPNTRIVDPVLARITPDSKDDFADNWTEWRVDGVYPDITFREDWKVWLPGETSRMVTLVYDTSSPFKRITIRDFLRMPQKTEHDCRIDPNPNIAEPNDGVVEDHSNPNQIGVEGSIQLAPDPGSVPTTSTFILGLNGGDILSLDSGDNVNLLS